MTTLRIQLLGGFGVEIDAAPISKFRSDKGRALLAWLAIRPNIQHNRSMLATLLWGDYAETAAKSYLRNELSRLKKTLNQHPALEITRTTVLLHGDQIEVDALLFQQGVEQEDAERVHQATTLYQGEFLAGLYLNDAVEFAEWQLLTQEKLYQQMMVALDWLQLHYTGQEAWAKLADVANRQLQQTAWHEAAHRSLLRALMAQGLTEAAQTQYARCRAVLAEELGSDLSAETETLWRDLNQTAAPSAVLSFHNLPQALPPLFGRIREQAYIDQLLQTRQQRLITLTGQGGSGKTRLAIAIGNQQRGNFVDGVWFVPLAGVQEVDAVLHAIADVLNMQFVGDQTPLEQVQRRLKDKALLLILDNCEHLPDEVADIVNALIDASEQLIMLVTSRGRLKLRIETILPLDGLPLPTEDDPQPASARFFQDQMQRINPLAQPDWPTIGRICSLLGGLPLGIEMAAAQAEVRTLDEILATLQSSLAQVESDMRDLPARQRSLRAVFESSWVLLTSQQQHALTQLAIFHGSFAGEDVLAVVQDTTPETLAALVVQSLLQQVEDGRYALHAIVCEFSAEKITHPHSAIRHRDHYLGKVRALAPQWPSLNFNQALQQSRLDWDNYNAAWQQAILTKDLSVESINAMREMYVYRGLYRDALPLFTQAAEAGLQQEWVTAARAWFLESVGLQEEAGALITQALATAEQAGDVALQTDLLLTQQRYFGNQDRYEEGIALLEQIKAIASDPIAVARAHFQAGFCHLRTGNPAEGRALIEPQVKIFQRQGSAFDQALGLRYLGLAHYFLGDQDSAETALNEGLTITKQRNDLVTGSTIITVLAAVYLGQGDYGSALTVLRDQLRYVRELGLKTELAVTLANLSRSLSLLGLYEEALPLMHEGMALFEQAGARGNQAVGLCLIGSCHHGQGDAAKAVGYLTESNAINAEIGAKSYESGTRLVSGDIYFDLNQLADAQGEYERALALAQGLEEGPTVIAALVALAKVALALGDRDSAEKHLKLVLTNEDWLQAHNAPTVGFDIFNLLRQLESQQANEYLRLAHKVLQEQAAKIADPTYRNALLNNVASHRAIVAAFKAL